MSLRTAATAALLFFSTASAHFVLTSPTSLEGTTIDDDKEDNAPCGALLPDLSKNTTNTFHVDGDFIALQSGHPQVNWLFRGTLEDKGSGNWTQLYPIFTQNGLGNYCQPVVKAPKEWVGKTGVVGIVSNAPDGLLYQCAVVNFVAGSNTPGSSCTNGSVNADFNTDATLTGLLGTPSTASSTPTPRPTGSSAVSTSVSFGSLLVAMAMAAVGAGLL
ncbi:hypothetical protein OQA88_988 [Cercophora sp. LCS_1]